MFYGHVIELLASLQILYIEKMRFAFLDPTLFFGRNLYSPEKISPRSVCTSAIDIFGVIGDLSTPARI